MCGRMVLTRSAREIADAFELTDADSTLELVPRYNIAPTQDVLAIRPGADGRREISLFYWGLVPHWAKDRSVGHRMINARAETAASKPAFRDALRLRRCIVPIDGFYEWLRLPKAPGEKGRGRSVPHYVRPAPVPAAEATADATFLAIAGLWEEWTDRSTGEVLESCTLLTTDANATVRPIHDRMPVVLDRAGWQLWLEPDLRDRAALTSLLVPAPADRLEAIEVSTRVNDPRNDEPDCITPAA